MTETVPTPATTPEPNGTTPAADEQAVLQQLRRRRRRARRRRPALVVPVPPLVEPPPEPVPEPVVPPTLGERMADRVASLVGSWSFILMQSAMIVVWVAGNALTGGKAWDPYPFILLNLMLSFQAAYTAPAIMMSQNRQAAIDRRRAEHDYEINIKAELEIELLHQKIDLMRETEILALTAAVRDLAARLEWMSERPPG